MLTRAEIDDILRLIDGSDFQEMTLEMGDLKIAVRKGGAVPAPAVATPHRPAPPPAPGPIPAIAAAGDGTAIPAPLLGIFWHAPRPSAAPFVQPGDSVTPETVIGIIEVMKLMNAVVAGMDGTVLDLPAPNGVLVEHGQTLIRIRPR
jgi:acetyl-CoA carboxylase biotin carboxyl carrier protein